MILKLFLLLFTVSLCYLKFFGFNLSFVNSDFSNETVFNILQQKPLFYKIAGTLGNHEGSLLSIISFNIIYIFIFVEIQNSLNNIGF